MADGARFGPERRLPDRAAFDHVFANARLRRRRNPFLLLARPRADASAAGRLGLVVGKRHAKRAVDRNLVRRLAREHFRTSPYTRGWDVVIMARAPLRDVPRARLDAALGGLVGELRAGSSS